jgi:hypothetical protein
MNRARIRMSGRWFGPANAPGMVGMRKRYWLLVLVPVAYLLLAGPIHLTLWRGERAERILLGGLTEKYPQFSFKAGHSYETPRVYLRALGVKDPAKQQEIRDWLVEFKSQRGISVEVWLKFDDEVFDPDSFKF